MELLELRRGHSRQPTQLSAVDPKWKCDFAWLATVGSIAGVGSRRLTSLRGGCYSGAIATGGYDYAVETIPSMHTTTWSEFGEFYFSGSGGAYTLSARPTGQAGIWGATSVNLVLWGVIDVVVSGFTIPAGPVRYCVVRNGATHTVYVNGRLFGTASQAASPIASSGVLPAIGAQAASGTEAGSNPNAAPNGPMAIFRTSMVINAADALALSANPYLALRPRQTVFFTSASAGPSLIVESGSAVDTNVATVIYAATSADSVTMSEALASIAAFNVTRVEALSGSDSSDGITTRSVSGVETGVAAEITSSIQTSIVSGSDGLVAAETVNFAGGAQSASNTEAGAASDTNVANQVGNSAVVESGSASDIRSASAIFLSSNSESGVAGETVNFAGGAQSANMVETISVSEIVSGSLVISASRSDLTSVAEITNYVGSTYTSSSSDSLTASDVFLSALFAVASQSEAGVLTDQNTGQAVYYLTQQEMLTVVDLISGSMPTDPISDFMRYVVKPENRHFVIKAVDARYVVGGVNKNFVV